MENAYRLSLWANDRDLPACNNLADRDLCSLAIARTGSFGVQSQDDAHARSVLMRFLDSLYKTALSLLI
jgi:hypothetical protein